MVAPLEGIRVVEIAHFVAAPSGGALLADLGADVIKVEVPTGEMYRHVRPQFMGVESDFPESPGFQMDNRGKRSLTLDLTVPGAVDALAKVIDTAQVVLTNMLPERRPKYGIDAETLLARCPALVFASLTGYGMQGEEASTPSFDYAAYWARSGLMDLMHDEGTQPAFLRPGVGDHAAGISLVAGILSALRVSERTGRGQVVDVSLMGIGIYVSGCDMATAAATGQTPPRHNRDAPSNPLWNQYRTKDERWLFLVMVETDRYWPIVCRALGRRDLEEDERFGSPEGRAKHSALLVSEFDRTFAQRDLSEWAGPLREQRVIWAPAQTMAEVLDDPQAKAMGFFPEVEHPEAGRFATVAPPFLLSESQIQPKAAAPLLGADTRDVLTNAGLDESEIAALTKG
jgi:crotonobetainyl-CoA:carnitine CoA-transferase CaiB-like acyl-CoA transferase